MNIAVFSSKHHDTQFLEPEAARCGHTVTFLEAALSPRTAALASGFEAVCVFVNDDVGREVIERLAAVGVKAIALRCAGFNNVDLHAAHEAGIAVVRVPAYSPNAVAEHAVALIMALNRKIHRAYNRVREGNFALDGLMGFDLHGRTVGVVGTGQIGAIFCRIMQGFGCRILAYDVQPNPQCQAAGVTYVDPAELVSVSDIVSLHCPLTPQTHHVVNARAIAEAKPGVMLINTSRGKLVDTQAVIDGLKSGQIGSLALDVYEEEADLFFRNLSESIIQDDIFARLLTFPNVLITAHQAFFTHEALTSIASTTMANLKAIEAGEACQNKVSTELIKT